MMELPIGTILLWDNSSVPTGWRVCDGTGGTPNLMNRFVMGCSNDNGLKTAGGVNSHNHSNGQSKTDKLIHRHNKYETTGDANEHFGIASGNNSVAAYNHTHQALISAQDDTGHDHTLGTVDSASNLPVYIKLVYIMKIS